MGTYKNSITNRRVSIPQAFRERLTPIAKKQFVVVRGKMKTLYFYPLDNWKPLEEKLSNGGQKERELLRFLRLYATKLKLEGPGRILLPQNLLDIIKVNKKVVFLGEGKFFSLWNPENFEKYKKQLDENYDKQLEVNRNLL